MRVGLVCPYSLSSPGGVQNHVLGLAEELVRTGQEVSVLAAGLPGEELPDFVVPAGRAVAVPYNGSVGRISFGPLVAARVGRWLGEGGFDVVHVHEPLAPSVSLLAVRASRASTSAPLVATFHIARERPRALAASANLLGPWLSRIDAHIAVSAEAARTVRRYLPVRPTVIPNGLHVERLAGGAGGRDGRTLLFLGRVDEPRKGLALLLEAWPRIRRAHPAARLLVAGPGRMPAAPAGVEHLGRVSEQRKRRVLAQADLLVAPNTHGESFGIVLAEAMAAGAAVLASDIPAFRAVLDEGRAGALFAAGDAGDLARTATTLLADPAARRRLVLAARREVRRYDWRQVGAQVAAVYAGVAEPGEADAV